MELEIKLSPQEIKQVLRDYLHSKFTEVEDVQFDIKRVSRGHGMSEEYISIFEGATCRVKI